MMRESPFRGERLVARVAPFAITSCIAFLALPLPSYSYDAGLLMAAAFVQAGTFIAGMVLASERLPMSLDILPPTLYLVVIALLRESQGGAASGYEPLVLLPVFWLSLHGTRGQLVVGLVGVAAVFGVPFAMVGDPGYPVEDLRRAVLWVIIATTVGFTVQGMVRRIEQLMRTDELSRLLNARGFDIELRREVKRSVRVDAPLSVAYLNVVEYESVRAEYGRRSVDRFVVTVARALSDVVRETDALGRLGTSTFAVLLPDCNAEDAEQVVARMRASLPEGVEVVHVVVVRTEDVAYENRHELLARAERALDERIRARDSMARSNPTQQY